MGFDVRSVGDRLALSERRARELLTQGCAADLRTIDRFISRPLERAKEKLLDELHAVGDIDRTFRRNLLRELSETIALECSREVFANVDVHFRARFALYADALAQAEQAFVDDIRILIADPQVRVHYQRRVTLPHVVLEDERSVVPDCEPSLEDARKWINELRVLLGLELEQQVYRAIRALTDRASASVARTRVAVRYAAQGKEIIL